VPNPLRQIVLAPSATELVRTYVWELPVRIAHWLIFFAFVSLASTGLFMHRRFLLPSASAFPDGHGAICSRGFGIRADWSVCVSHVLVFKGNFWARWSAYIPFTASMARYGIDDRVLLVLRSSRPSGRSYPLAALTYFIIYLLFLVEILTAWLSTAGWW